MSQKKFYKVVTARNQNGKLSYYSACIHNTRKNSSLRRLLCLSYVLNKVTRPKIGGIFLFENKKSAIKFCREVAGNHVLVGSAEGPKRWEWQMPWEALDFDMVTVKKNLQIFWKNPSYLGIPMAYGKCYVADTFRPEAVIYKAGHGEL